MCHEQKIQESIKYMLCTAQYLCNIYFQNHKFINTRGNYNLASCYLAMSTSFKVYIQETRVVSMKCLP